MNCILNSYPYIHRKFSNLIKEASLFSATGRDLTGSQTSSKLHRTIAQFQLIHLKQNDYTEISENKENKGEERSLESSQNLDSTDASTRSEQGQHQLTMRMGEISQGISTP